MVKKIYLSIYISIYVLKVPVRQWVLVTVFLNVSVTVSSFRVGAHGWVARVFVQCDKPENTELLTLIKDNLNSNQQLL